MDDAIRKHALQNAVSHAGKADAGAVLGKVLGEQPDLRSQVSTVREHVHCVLAEVNALSPDEQVRALEALGGPAPAKEARQGLPPLPQAEQGKVVTRFAPAPTGPLHLLHALRAVFISYLYARQYGGIFILRFEDTDPRKVEEQFFAMIREDLAQLGVQPDLECKESGYMDLYYQQARLLLEGGHAYVCTCPAADFQRLKEARQDCPCRWQRLDKALLRWQGMLEGSFAEGAAVIRLKTGMQEPNPALRDPPLLRVVDHPHPLHGARWRVWPLYNFANAIMDHTNGVTHAFRGKEHEHNTAVQEMLYRSWGWTPPITINFGMMYLPGAKLHKRDIRQGLAEGRYRGWDDLQLPTLRAYFRRGFQAEAIRQFAVACGLSKTDITLDIRNLEALNRRLLDPIAARYMAVVDPVPLDVSAILRQTGLGGYVEVKNHPEKPETRQVAISPTLHISREDAERFAGRRVRLIELFNVLLEDPPRLDPDQSFDLKTPKIQWVAEKQAKVQIHKPGESLAAAGESALGALPKGTLVQLMRIGFGRVESPGSIAFAHK